MSKKQTIAIIGGGAAGMMVAATLIQRTDRDGEILLFEKNKSLGNKVIISGGGRCNLTTGFVKRSELQSKYTRGRGFFDHSLKGFTPRSVKKRFETNGIPCKEEDDKRVFPVSNDGKDVVRVFEKIFEDPRIHIHYSEGVERVTKQHDVFSIDTKLGKYEADKLILTTGGNAYSHTGSTGDGYHFAQSLGHSITKLGPSLNSFVTRQDWIHSLSGLSFDDAKIHMSLPIHYDSNSLDDENDLIEQQKHTVNGPILLTHFGISGPLTFIAASLAAFQEISTEIHLDIHLQVLSQMNYDKRNDFLLTKSQSSKKEIFTTLSTKLPKRFCVALLSELEIQLNLRISQLSKKQRVTLADRLGNGIPLSLVKRRPGDEFVTAGGVNTDEINPKTMESLITPGLFFAGEILNVDGVTGGYNLQMCWSTGRCVGFLKI